MQTKYIKNPINIALLSLILLGCASSSKEIGTTHVSPIIYQHLDCMQIALEAQRVIQQITLLGGQVDEKAQRDAVATGVGIVLFWPALFFIRGDGAEAAEYSRLKGEYEALQKMAIQKRCDPILPAPPTGTPNVVEATASENNEYPSSKTDQVVKPPVSTKTHE